jgi:sarcosine oxidase
VSARCDLVVAGLGATGGATAAHAAARGLRVIGLDARHPPHAHGSSHGGTRIIREAYFEDPLYVPLVQRAYEGWRALERDAGRTLLVQTGGLMIGPPGGALVTGALASARAHGLAHEVLDGATTRRRFPALRVGDTDVAVWEPRAGALFPEACVAAQLAAAAHAGAVLWTGTPLLGFESGGEGVRVRTPRGDIEAGALVLAAGAWMPGLAPTLAGALTVERVVQVWFAPEPSSADLWSPAHCPVWIWEHAHARYWYGFPAFEGRVKAARHHEGEPFDPDTPERAVPAHAVEALARELAPRLAGLGPPVDAAVCLYTNTTDQHFLIDHLPGTPRVIAASACSGHGFKFAPALGEAIAGWVATGERPAAFERFRWRTGSAGAC